MPDADVVVVGGGLAGCTAALAAVGADSGVTVRLVTAGDTSLQAASGLVDVLGYRPDDPSPVTNPFDAIGGLPESHPYRRVGVDALAGGLSLFDEVTGDRYCGGHTDRNALVPTYQGRVKPTARYPAGVANGLASDGENALFVGFESLTDFDACLLAERLDAANVPFVTDCLEVSFPWEFGGQPPHRRMARALDENEPVDGRPLREALTDLVENHRHFDGRIGFPAVLGEHDAQDVRADIADALDSRVFEVPMGPPSVLGARLEAVLREALRTEGVSVHEGSPVVDVETDGEAVELVLAETAEGLVEFTASAFVLATGGLVGGGLQSDRQSVTEPVFGCPVSVPSDRERWSDPEPLSEHAFARFGVRIDGDSRPLDGDGAPVYENLFAAGSVVGGYDPAAELSASGVSLTTGYRSGTISVD